MSLIQEALKRKQDGPQPGGGVPPETLGDRKEPARPAASNNALPLTAIIIGCGLLALVLFLMLLVFSGNSKSSTSSVVRQTVPPQETTALAEVVPAETVLAQTPVAPAPAPVVPEPIPVEKPAPAVAPPVAVLQPAPAVVQVAPTVQPPPPAAKDPAAWPLMRVMGVLTNPESNSDSVIVNGQIRDPGEMVNGVKILRVETKGVWFKFNNETQFVKVGRSYPE